jgi:hypothetical protein
VIKVEVAQSELGRVLDFYFDKNLRNDWEEYLRNRESGDVVLSGGPAEIYYGHFVNWVYGKGMRLSDFDTIIGPEYIRGGSQICIRNKAIAERLIKHAEEVARAHEPLGPAYPDPGLNGRLDLLNKLKP